MPTMAVLTSADNGLVQQRGRLAQIFAAAFVLVEPFFDQKNSWGGQPLEQFAFRALREEYPDLSGEELVVLLAAVQRVYATS